MTQEQREAGYEAGKEDAEAGREPSSYTGSADWSAGYARAYADHKGPYSGPTCNHPHDLPNNDECAVWWLRGSPLFLRAHTNASSLGAGHAYEEKA